MRGILDRIRAELGEKADAQTKESGVRFFKEDVRLHGVKTALVQKMSETYFKEIAGKDKAEIFALCEDLWKSGFMEESFIACHWSYFLEKRFEPADFEVFEAWVKGYVNNWASCDTLCNHTVGSFVERFPDYAGRLKIWARSESRWVRRAAAVTFIIPARKGLFREEIFEIADTLLLDGDDLVQKGYGWMLKAASQARQDEVFRYVLAKKAGMPRTALRYAIEKMPPELKKQAMEK